MGTEKGVAAMVCIVKVERNHGKIKVTLDDGRTFFLIKSCLQDWFPEADQIIDEKEFEKRVLLNQYRSALDKAVGMLAVRARSRGEIEQGLRRNGFAGETIKMVIYKLESNQLLNDQEFAFQWVNYRMGQKYGPRRITQELKMKGISGEDAEKALSEMEEEDYLKDAIVIGRKASLRLKSTDDLRKARQKISAAIVRRGYDWEVARQACDYILDNKDFEK